MKALLALGIALALASLGAIGTDLPARAAIGTGCGFAVVTPELAVEGEAVRCE